MIKKILTAKDRAVGVIKKPEQYVPYDLFQNVRLNPQEFEKGSFHPSLGDTGKFDLTSFCKSELTEGSKYIDELTPHI